jgi:hypothetical protein
MTLYCGKTEISPLILDRGIKKLLHFDDQIKFYACIIATGIRKDNGKEETIQLPISRDVNPKDYFKSDFTPVEGFEPEFSPLERLNQLLKSPKNKGFKVSPKLINYIKQEERTWNRTHNKPNPEGTPI